MYSQIVVLIARALLRLLVPLVAVVRTADSGYSYPLLTVSACAPGDLGPGLHLMHERCIMPPAVRQVLIAVFGFAYFARADWEQLARTINERANSDLLGLARGEQLRSPIPGSSSAGTDSESAALAAAAN